MQDMNTRQSSTTRRNASYEETAPSHEGRGRAWHSNGDQPKKKRPSFGVVVLIAIAIAAIVFGIQMCSTAAPITVTVNGAHYTLRGAKNMQVAIKESGLPVNPGDYITLQGNVIERSEGYPFFAVINGDAETADPEYQLRNGDVIELFDGKDRVEEYDAVERPVPYGGSIVGTGVIRTFKDGVDGVLEVRTGKVSGEVVEKQTVDPQSAIETRHNLDVGDKKIVALTFDDGPSAKYTKYVLDILQKNGARATFFCTGKAVKNGGADLVRRAESLGCQICTHSYDNAAVTNGDMGKLSAEEQIDQVEHGRQVIADVLGHEASRVIRLGNEDMNETAVVNLASVIDAEVGWTLDTGDWVQTTEDAIYDVLMSMKPGDVVRMHDGGTHQSATVKAFNRALPKLKQKGFEFVTIDEMMPYVQQGEG